MEDKKEEIKLTKEELTLIAKVLFNNRWNGQEYEQTIRPLVEKLRKLAELGK